ncbi:hypothetical protein HNQ94_000395 [Salirhabdus euzebyi]|uniref:Uncharacterized protein n=1 Tax=Salirhabdus euzebyi TaxID=394506 RepID=A0A841PW18_9BACI|nr:hypothetical protein [Salirhabdus euzebyi]MBB6451974.1 hypothetical protein [Salirhabdus euzebyi]
MSYKDAELLTDKNGNPIPQYFDVSANVFKPITSDNQKDLQQVKDDNVLTKLTELDSKVEGIVNGTTKIQSDTKVTGSTVTLDTNLTNIEDLLYNQREIINVLSDSALVFGAYWDKSSNPTLTRTDAAEGKVANAGVDGQLVQNDFDSLPIYRDIGEVTDDNGNVFIRIPKFYIRKKDGQGFKLWQISKMKYTGFYLPWCFWDFENNKELDYIDVGKYKASLSDTDKLESKVDKHPLVSRNIVQFRDYARNNGAGYQQLDIHVMDVLQTLFYVEFATLNSQSVMNGFTSGRVSESDTITVAELATNRAIVSNATASYFRVGQSITINNSIWSNTEPRIITDIQPYDVDNTAITFDGDPIDTVVGEFISNRGWVNGFSRNILASSGSIVSNSDGKHPCVYRGIESPWGDIYQFVDGININDHQTWVAKNADDYTSNVFASPYEQVGYVNSNTNGYVSEMGYDTNNPFVELPVNVSGGSTTYYSDYYYQSTGQRIALVGGYWSYGSSAGLSYWALYASSGNAYVILGGRLLKKPL